VTVICVERGRVHRGGGTVGSETLTPVPGYPPISILSLDFGKRAFHFAESRVGEG
jgi:hypothetical protein